MDEQMQTPADETYNGWTNQETWVVGLWLSNEYSDYQKLQHWIEDYPTTPRLARLIQNWVYWQRFPTIGGYTAALWEAVQRVNFEEIAHNELADSVGALDLALPSKFEPPAYHDLERQFIPMIERSLDANRKLAELFLEFSREMTPRSQMIWRVADAMQDEVMYGKLRPYGTDTGMMCDLLNRGLWSMDYKLIAATLIDNLMK